MAELRKRGSISKNMDVIVEEPHKPTTETAANPLSRVTSVHEHHHQHHGPYDPLARKWLIPRVSLLSQASDFNNFRGFVNLAILLLAVSNVRVAIENIQKYGILVSPMSWLALFTNDPHNWPSTTLFLSLNLYCLAALYIERRIAAKSISAQTGQLLNYLNLTLELLVPAYFVVLLHPSPVTSMPVMFMVCLVWMKLVSYMQVNRWEREAAAKRKAQDEKPDDTPGVCIYPHNLTVKDMYYFLAAPTMCYDLNFPRTPKIRVRFAIRRLLETCMFALLLISLCQQWMVPTVMNSLEPLSRSDIFSSVIRLLKLAIPNIVLWIIGFYCLFHSFLNLTAELIQFGDRCFYRDWWNATTITYFWRNWNMPVHAWATRHIYLPLVTSNWSKLQASLAVFLLSAVFHELLVSVPLGMFRIWSFTAMIAQVPMAYLTDKYFKGSQYGNAIVWVSVVMGQPFAILMYVYDYVALHQAHQPIPVVA